MAIGSNLATSAVWESVFKTKILVCTDLVIRVTFHLGIVYTDV